MDIKKLEVYPGIKALIFDLDGTLADTMPVHFLAYKNILTEYGIDFSPDLVYANAGYSTLYGDLTGGLCPIGDLTKTEVFALSNWYNREFELIPQQIIDRPPSAELRPNQKDSDTLPEYDTLDPAIIKIVEKYQSPKTNLEKEVLFKMMRNEFKRWQAPPILKVSNHAFGRGRRLPIAHKAYY